MGGWQVRQGGDKECKAHGIEPSYVYWLRNRHLTQDPVNERYRLVSSTMFM
jgi:hypothetical protein